MISEDVLLGVKRSLCGDYNFLEDEADEAIEKSRESQSEIWIQADESDCDEIAEIIANTAD